MKKTLLSVIIATLSTFTLISCGDESGMLTNPDGVVNPSDPNGNPGNPNNPNATNKCYIKEIKTTSADPDDASTVKLTYNSKNLIESREDNGEKTTFEYDENNRLTKINAPASSGINRSETLYYEYDGKGNMSKIKYEIKDPDFDDAIIEYALTINAKGLVEKVRETSPDQEGFYDYLLEYDGKNNITKVILVEDGEKTTLVENLKFDDKSNAYVNANLAKAFLPLILMGADFGLNITYYFNTNNILSDKIYSPFTEEYVPGTYDYAYSPEGYPLKMTISRKTSMGTEKEEQTFTYSCK